MHDIKDLNLDELKEFLAKHKEPFFRAKQIFRWLYQKNALSFAEMSDLSVALRKKLEDNFTSEGLALKEKLVSCDGTEKFLFCLKEGFHIEAVMIPTEKRFTGCVSSQVGCKFKCSFCASGSRGFKRNLSTGEILQQIMDLKNSSEARKLTHLVFMGTGEPLDNYDNLLKAIRIINSPDTLNIGARRITISTCGLIPGIERLANEGLQVELSVSLHAADDKVRDRLMPVNRQYPIKELVAACKEYIRKTNRQVTFEYILIEGVNSDLQSARKVVKLLTGLNCKVNLIPANPITGSGVGSPGKMPALSFSNTLTKNGITATLRKSRGGDIDAACGQLRARYEK